MKFFLYNFQCILFHMKYSLSLKVFFLLGLCSFMLIAESVESDRVKVEADSKGNVMIYSLLEEGGPLLFNEDSGTSALYIYDGEKRIKPTEDDSFKPSFTTDETSLYIQWSSPSLIITEQYRIISSDDHIYKDGVVYSLDIQNNTAADKKIGLLWLLDTALGEDSRDHFQLSTGQGIKKESVFYKGDMPDYWISSDGENRGLKCILKGNNIITPDELFFTNWERFQKSGNTPFSPETGRSFSLLPYSVNDSSAGLWYSPVKVGPSEKRFIRFIMGSDITRSYSVAQKKSEERENPLTGMSDEEINEQLTEYIYRLNQILDAINENLSNRDGNEKLNIDILNETMQEIEKDVETYEKYSR